jgi:transposase
VIGPAGNFRVYLACGVTDMRKGFDTLAAQVQTLLKFDPHNGALYAFRGRRGDLIKILWWDGQGLCLFCKRIERGKFIWPQAKDGSVSLTPAQLSMLVEGIDWRAPVRSGFGFTWWMSGLGREPARRPRITSSARTAKARDLAIISPLSMR